MILLDNADGTIYKLAKARTRLKYLVACRNNIRSWNKSAIWFSQPEQDHILTAYDKCIIKLKNFCWNQCKTLMSEI